MSPARPGRETISGTRGPRGPAALDRALVIGDRVADPARAATDDGLAADGIHGTRLVTPSSEFGDRTAAWVRRLRSSLDSSAET
ncbi:hypothetical protein BJF83_22150 [Nocardiopsis sp. CNR-923]|nr:hypothetical protein BJF83_22150 [Nocardiopsis sp. CNR-923]